MKALGIDIGTTGICGVLLDMTDGAVLKSRTESSNAFIDGVAEYEKIQSVDRIIGLATDILDGLMTDDVAVIGVTGQMHGIVYTDACGKAVSPLYTWQDGRGSLPYKDTTYAAYLCSFTGYGAVTDFYNRTCGVRPAEAVAYSTIGDYLVMHLTGRVRPLIHPTNLASFGLYDLKTGSTEADFGGEICNGYAVAGYYKGIPVAVAVGDNQASLYSSLSSSGEVLFNVGTGSQVTVVTDGVTEGEGIEVRPYFDGRYIAVGAALCGGRAYSMLKNFYSDVLSAFGCEGADVYAVMGRLLEGGRKAALRVDTRFAGTRAHPDITGGVYGITADNFTPTELTYGFLNGMAQELCELLGATGITPTGIVGSGNGIRKNKHLVKIFEERFGMRMKIPVHTEEAAVGAAMYGLVSAGLFDTDNVKKIIKYISEE